ncbi:DUF58 domain-containing protein [Glaciihabitans sp. dw_435]|uniref:DUF58 domain-containing protein n=1 Tax=Glaciihabitans sp. dw_435 TaxID=2720081 RepID=UPI001BD6B76D|nr:DUF58 domain-containing protein [Glaciihabitans sp. dw_435]
MPRTSPRRSTTRLTRRGWYFVALAAVFFVVAYSSGSTTLLYAASFLGVLIVAAALLVRLRRLRLSVVRTFSPVVVPAGSPVDVELSVTNVSLAASGPATWADRIPWNPGTAGPGQLPALAAALPGRVTSATTARLSYTLRPPTRGIYTIGPLEVEYADPFGLSTGRASLAGVQSLVVVPATVSFGEGGPSIVSGDGSARLIQRRTTGSDDDLMTREYRSGDALRRVHWRASARHGELMVRQEEQRTFPEARVLLDTRSDGYADVWAELGGEEGGKSAFEWAVRMIASLGVHLHRSGFRVQLLETGHPQIAALGDINQGSGQDLEFLVSLAALELSPAPPPSVGTDGMNRADGAPGPIFAVLSISDPDTLRWIMAQRRPRELGVAFIVGRGTDHVLETLGNAGWICVPVGTADDPALAWSSIARFSAAVS